MVRDRNVLSLFTSQCASRHKGVQFLPTAELPKVVRDRRALPLFTSQRSSRHNSVHFFHISTSKGAPRRMCFDTFHFEMCLAPHWRALFHSHLPTCLRTRRFSERPSGAANHWKNTVSRLSYLFAHLQLLSSDFLRFSSSPCLIFSLLTFSMSEFLPGCAFPSVHIVGTLVSKLPSNIQRFCWVFPYGFKVLLCIPGVPHKAVAEVSKI